MKKLVCSLLLVAMMAVMLAPAVFAAGTSVAVSSEIAEPGSEVELKVTITGNTGFGSGKYTVSYDTDVLTLEDLDVADKLLDGAAVNDEKGVISFASATSVTEDGVLFTAKFKVAADAADGDYEVSVAVQDVVNAETKEPVEIVTNAGKVTVKAPHVCVGTYVEKVEASCEEDGMEAHYVCECGKLYSDEACTNEVSAEALVIKATGHDWEWVIDKEATQTETGLKHEVCKNCGATQNEGTVIDKLPPVPPTGDSTVALMAVAAIMGVLAVGGVYVTKRKTTK